MGLNKSKENKALSSLSCNFYCDDNGIIQKTCHNSKILGYDENVIVGQSITIMMTDIMKFLHENIFFPRLRKADAINKIRLVNKISERTRKQPIIIFTINREPLFSEMKIELDSNLYQITFTILEKSIRNIFSNIDIVKKESTFRYTKTNTIICSIDFVNSTPLLKEKGEFYMANLSLEFFNIVKDLIKTNYYPYIYIHEIVGDSFVFIINSDWTYYIDDFCATICMNFLNELVQCTKHLIEIRIGCAYGKIFYGFIGEQLRIFGDTINLASRLEHMSVTNYVLCSQSMYTKLLSEMKETDIYNTKEIEVEPKGLDKQSAFLISLTTLTPPLRRRSISNFS